MKEKVNIPVGLIRCDQATPGPWEACSYQVASMDELVEENAQLLRKGGLELHWLWGMPLDPVPLAPAITGNGPTSKANALFVEHVRTAYPLALEELQRLRDALEELTLEEYSDEVISIARAALGVD